MVDQLNKRKSYKVIQVGNEGDHETVITNFKAINTKINEEEAIEEIKSADIVTCSVGPKILRFIAPLIARGIDRRSKTQPPVTIIACENAIGATDTLAEHIKDPCNTNSARLEDLYQRARFANSAIDRIVPAQDPHSGIDVKLERYYEWIIDQVPFGDQAPPEIKGVKWVDNLSPYIERKLLTVNTGHATAAYHGYFQKKDTVYDALQVPAIREEVQKVLAETSSLIVHKHQISEKEQKEYVEKIIKRLENPHLKDTVVRVGRAPMRKLSRKDRFILPAAELARDGRPFDALLRAIEMAFRFQNVEGDGESFELAQMIKEANAEYVLHKVCGLTPEDKVFPHILEIVKKLQAEG